MAGYGVSALTESYDSVMRVVIQIQKKKIEFTSNFLLAQRRVFSTLSLNHLRLQEEHLEN